MLQIDCQKSRLLLASCPAVCSNRGGRKLAELLFTMSQTLCTQQCLHKGLTGSVMAFIFPWHLYMLYSSLFFICSVSPGLSVCFGFFFSQLWTYLLWATPRLHSGYAIEFSFRIISANIRAKFLLRGTKCLRPEQIARSQLSSFSLLTSVHLRTCFMWVIS